VVITVTAVLRAAANPAARTGYQCHYTDRCEQ
jgi:hypothetical protein